MATQGGWAANDCKYKSPKGFMNRIPMLITCQTPMDFGKDHQAAMDSRLNKYIFKTLPSVNPAAIGWLEKHPMDCIHWATIQMASQPNSTGGETSTTLAGELNDDEIKELFQFNLSEDLVDETPASPLRQTSQYVSCDMESLEQHLEHTREGSLESRQLTALLQTRDSAREMWLKDSAEKAIERYFSLNTFSKAH